MKHTLRLLAIVAMVLCASCTVDQSSFPKVRSISRGGTHRMATVKWTDGAQDGDLGNGANWHTGTKPGSGDRAIINTSSRDIQDVTPLTGDLAQFVVGENFTGRLGTVGNPIYIGVSSGFATVVINGGREVHIEGSSLVTIDLIYINPKNINTFVTLTGTIGGIHIAGGKVDILSGMSQIGSPTITSHSDTQFDPVVTFNDGLSYSSPAIIFINGGIVKINEGDSSNLSVIQGGGNVVLDYDSGTDVGLYWMTGGNVTHRTGTVSVLKMMSGLWDASADTGDLGITQATIYEPAAMDLRSGIITPGSTSLKKFGNPDIRYREGEN